MKDLANQKKELGGDGCSGGSRTVGPQLPLDNADLPAIFWDSMPETAEQHADYAGLQAMAEESTLEERADNFKVWRDMPPMYSQCQSLIIRPGLMA